jgi:uncharacterized OB-fold protein
MPKCATCGTQIEAAARICQRCGALTGAEMRAEPHAGVFSFVAAVAVGIIAATLLKWLGFL